MKILRFNAEKLHGYLSFTIKFETDLVFLTGINGAGKTSAVRSITALLGPSFISLALMEYASISVTVTVNSGELTISSQRTSGELILSCSGVKEEFRLPLIKKEPYETQGRFMIRQREFYRDKEATCAPNPTLAAIDRLPTPMYLDLDRRNQEVGSVRMRDEGEFVQRASPTNPLAVTLRNGLDVAERLAVRNYREYSLSRSRRTDTLKQEIVLAAFRPSTDDEHLGLYVPSTNERKDVLKRIGIHENVLPHSLEQIGVPGDRIEQIVLPFFGRVREVINELPSQKRLSTVEGFDAAAFKRLQEWSAIRPQVQQIDHLGKVCTSSERWRCVASGVGENCNSAF